MWIGFSAAGILGPSVLTSIHNATGSYQGAFLVAIAMAALGISVPALGIAMAFRKKQHPADSEDDD